VGSLQQRLLWEMIGWRGSWGQREKFRLNHKPLEGKKALPSRSDKSRKGDFERKSRILNEVVK
jgi:hypothetical protein